MESTKTGGSPSATTNPPGATSDISIEHINVIALVVPAEEPESDSTQKWDKTTVVLVEVHAGGQTGMGYTYATTAVAQFIDEVFTGLLEGHDAMDVTGAWDAMHRAVRNLGRSGLTAMGVSAVDTALWDLKARLLGVSLVDLLGPVREQVPIYGSGGYTSYSIARLQDQLSRWIDEGIPQVKIKVGRHPEEDLERARAARDAIGGARLFVDANGAYSRKQALRFADQYAALDVSWLEEPVTSDDLDGLRLVRDRAPAGMEITAGEYGYTLFYFRRMLEANCIDVLQVDACRCGGFSGFLRAAALCEARSLEVSSHNAPNLHAHVCCAALPIRHVEYFYEQARVERILFEGVLDPTDGSLQPDRSRPGMGLTLKRADAQEYLAYGTLSD